MIVAYSASARPDGGWEEHKEALLPEHLSLEVHGIRLATAGETGIRLWTPGWQLVVYRYGRILVERGILTVTVAGYGSGGIVMGPEVR